MCPILPVIPANAGISHPNVMMDKAIHYYSTNLQVEPVTFREALLKGLAPDRGLYMPEEIPQISSDELLAFSIMGYDEIAYAVTHKFLHSEISDEALQAIDLMEA